MPAEHLPKYHSVVPEVTLPSEETTTPRSILLTPSKKTTAADLVDFYLQFRKQNSLNS